MKVLVTLDLTDPRHVQIFDELRGPVAPPEYTNAIASPAGPAVAVAPGAAVAPQAAASIPQPTYSLPATPAPVPLANQAPLQPLPGQSAQQAIQAANAPMPQPAPNPVAPSVSPPAGVQVPPAQPDVPQPTLPTPTTDLQLELTKSFALAMQADTAAAQALGGQLRDEYGVDNTAWTDEQLKTAITRVQALATF